jgi:hypothetical protein
MTIQDFLDVLRRSSAASVAPPPPPPSTLTAPPPTPPAPLGQLSAPALEIARAKQSVVKPLSTTEPARERIALSMQIEDLWLKRDNRELRKKIAKWVGAGLGIEIFLLFTLVIAQGVGRFPVVWINAPHWRALKFSLDQSTFSLFTSSVLLQTFGLALVIVQSLFPKPPGDKGD